MPGGQLGDRGRLRARAEQGRRAEHLSLARDRAERRRRPRDSTAFVSCATVTPFLSGKTAIMWHLDAVVLEVDLGPSRLRAATELVGVLTRLHRERVRARGARTRRDGGTHTHRHEAHRQRCRERRDAVLAPHLLPPAHRCPVLAVAPFLPDARGCRRIFRACRAPHHPAATTRCGGQHGTRRAAPVDAPPESVRRSRSGELGQASFQADFTDVPVDLAFGLQLHQVRVHLPAGRLDQLGVQLLVAVERGDDVDDA